MRLTAREITAQVSRGNAGAMVVVTDLLMYRDGAKQAMKLKELDVTGALLWLCYSDMLDCNMDKLYELLKTKKLEGEILVMRSRNKRFDQNWEFYVERNKQKEVNDT